MFSYFENLKYIYIYIYIYICSNCSIETKAKTLFLILYYSLSKNLNGTTGAQLMYPLSVINYRKKFIIDAFTGW